MSLNRTKYLEPAEVLSLRAGFSLKDRDCVLLSLALETGARAQEILNIKQSDLFLSDNVVLIRGLKGSRDRELPVRPDLMKALVHFVPFTIKYRRLEQVWRCHRPVKKKFHSLRHTFAIELYIRTKDLKLVQLALGHASPTSTAVYTDFLYARDEMRRILPQS